MLARLFALIDGEESPGAGRAEIPCILECAPHPLAARQDEAGGVGGRGACDECIIEVVAHRPLRSLPGTLRRDGPRR